eukprot:GHVS01043108.1.p1 GENE.GHVS01043108.1~~GHVS01043108.1.p1  ORF type:complete len:712 (+),score=135.40 GHVS01043108.1:43-2178(+)
MRASLYPPLFISLAFFFLLSASCFGFSFVPSRLINPVSGPPLSWPIFVGSRHSVAPKNCLLCRFSQDRRPSTSSSVPSPLPFVSYGSQRSFALLDCPLSPSFIPPRCSGLSLLPSFRSINGHHRHRQCLKSPPSYYRRPNCHTRLHLPCPSSSLFSTSSSAPISAVSENAPSVLSSLPSLWRRRCRRPLLSFFSSLSSLLAAKTMGSSLPLYCFLFHRPPLLLQVVVALSFYFLHMLVLSKHSVPLHFELIPNPWNMFTSVGLDTIAGVIAGLLLVYVPNRASPPLPEVPPPFAPANGTAGATATSSTNCGALLSSSSRSSHPSDCPSDWPTASFPSPPPFVRPPLWQAVRTREQRSRMVLVVLLLGISYLASGYGSLCFEWLLYGLAAAGLPISVPMHRSLQVLLGHLLWVSSGAYLLNSVLPVRTKGLLQSTRQCRRRDTKQPTTTGQTTTTTASDAPASSPCSTTSASSSCLPHSHPNSLSPDRATTSTTPLSAFFPLSRSTWYSFSVHSQWVWWSVCGYFLSSLLFVLAEFASAVGVPLVQILLKHAFEIWTGRKGLLGTKQGGPGGEEQQHREHGGGGTETSPPPPPPPPSDSIVNQMLNPENNDTLALLVGALAPCVSAPLWEELLYRGFTLPVLSHFLPCMRTAVPLSAVLFSAHHMNMQSFIPLCILGYLWALLYVHSNNLFVTVVVHSMWNSRVFLGTLWGL